MALYSLPKLGKTACWLQPCEPVPGEAQKLPLQLVLCRLSLDPSPQHPWLGQRPGNCLQLPPVCFFLCLAQGAPVTPEHLQGIPVCLALGHKSLELTVHPCLRTQIQGLTLQWRQFGTHTLAPWNPCPPVPGTLVSSSFHCNQHALCVFWSQLFVALLSLMDSMTNTSLRMVAPAHLSPTGRRQQQRQPNPSVSRHQCQDCLWVRAAPQPGNRSPASASS